MQTSKISPLWLLLSGFLLGILTAFLIQRPADTTELQEKIAELKSSIKAEEEKNRKLLNKNAAFSSSLDSLNEAYKELLSKPISVARVDSLQKKEIAKGRRRYGQTGGEYLQSALASAFGNRAFDELDVLDRKIQTQVKVIGIQNGISLKKDSIIVSQTDFIKKAQKKATNNNLRSFLQGVFGGSFATLLLLLLL